MEIKKYKLRIPLWPTIVAWFLYGHLMAYGIFGGYISDMGYVVWDVFGQYIPSIMRLMETGSESRKYLASVMLASMPFLFTALLFTDVEEHIKGVRIKKLRLKQLLFAAS